MRLSPFLKILRIQNLVLLGFSVAIGFWLSHAQSGLTSLLLLVIAALSCAGFGNVVNDLVDVETDRISHPERPLSRKEISPRQAIIFSCLLALISLACSFGVSVAHGIGVVVPLVMLVLYAGFLKGTPLAGNMLVSVLVAYGIIFGGLTSDGSYRLYIPSLLAFLLNLPREIVKDIQDRSGDSAAGITTSAVLPAALLRTITAGCAVAYAALVFMPFIMHHFGVLYAVFCLVAVIPLHICWLVLFAKANWKEKCGTISLLIKYEMLCGLCALALDRLFVLRI